MSQSNEQLLRSHPLFHTFELLEMIFLGLNPKDTVQASSVCRFWNQCVHESRKLMRAVFKLSEKHYKDPNPHFYPPNTKSRNALMPAHPTRPSLFAGQELLHLYEAADTDFLQSAKPNMDLTAQEDLKDSYEILRRKYRCGLRDFRRPNGWPSGYHEIHCNICDGFHLDFKFSKVHPLLHFLEDVSLCFRGHGPHLYLDINIVADCDAPLSCYEHYCTEIRFLGNRLRRATDLIESCGLDKDLFIRPACTRLVSDANQGFDTVDNPDGVTLAEALPFLIRQFKLDLSVMQRFLHRFLQCPAATWHEQASPELAVLYPTPADWKAHVDDYGKMLDMCDATVWEVHELLKSIPAWHVETLLIAAKEAKVNDIDHNGRELETLPITAEEGTAEGVDHDGL